MKNVDFNHQRIRQARVSIKDFNPKYGFSVIKAGTRVYIETWDNQYNKLNWLARIRDLNNRIIGNITISKLNTYFN